jgi:hypothetical protein
MITEEERWFLVEALEEFVDARTPVQEYVARRYEPHNEDFRKRKLETVQRRVEKALELIQKLNRGEIL